MGKEFVIQTDSESDDLIPNGLKITFRKVFDPTLPKRHADHSVVASVETTTEEPISCKARRLSPDKFRALQDELKRLCEQGVLKRSQSAWSCPIVMVKKKSGSWRLCADLTSLNKILKPRKYALPNVNDFTSLAHGCTVFSSIDIADAYYNIKVDPKDRHKLTITTPLGNYQYNYLPMGLASSSTYFQLLMNEVVAGIPQTFCYLDDVIIMSKSHSEHLLTLHTVFARLRDHGLVVNASKCNMGVKSLSFLGFDVSPEGLLPSQTEVKVVDENSLPNTKKLLRSYLGMYRYHAKFVPNSAEFLQPLYYLLNSKCQSLKWTDPLIQCFEESKKALSSAKRLVFPDPDAQTELVVDASGFRIGAVLQQVNDDATRPIAFWSKSLSDPQKSWSAFERELYACYTALKHFHYFLDALEFTLKTDHRPIVNKFYSNALAGSPRQQRYLDYIAQMTNKVAHVPGEKNASDFLSRSCQPSLGAILPSEPALDYFRIALSQRSDPELDQLRLGNLDSNMSFQLVQVALADHDISLLCDKSHSRLRPIIPKALRPDIFRLHHSWFHPGAKTGIKLVGQRFVWPGMRQDIRKWSRECQACARAKVQRHNISPLSTVTPPPSGRFTNVYVDITGPLGSSNCYNYLLVIIDRYSRYMNAIPMVSITAEECVDSFIRHWVIYCLLSLSSVKQHVVTFCTYNTFNFSYIVLTI